MKLTYFQLGPHLAKKIMPAYIVSGDDHLLKQEAIDLIRQAATKAGFTERTRLIAESGFDWEQLHSYLFSTSLLAEKQLLELNLNNAMPNKAGSAIICNYMQHPSPDQVLLIDLGKADAKISKSAWYQAIEKNSIVITIWPMPREQLPKWLTDRAKKTGIQLTHDAAVMLGEYCEGNLSSAAQAIEKLALLNLDKPIDARVVMKALQDESRFNIFDFVEALFTNDKNRALHILESLKEDGTDPVLVLWAVTRELRMLSTMAREIKSGTSYDKLYQKHRIFARRQTTIRRFLSNASEEFCHQLLTHAANIDRILKGAETGNAWQNLQLFCLRLV